MLANFLFLILCLFAGCSFPEPSKKLTEEEIFKKERDRRIYSALRKFKHAMEAKGYRAAGLGEGIDHATGKQNYLAVTFDIEYLPDVDFARKIEVEALQEFLNYINSEEGMQDYVIEYPYPLKFIEIAFINRHPEKGLFSVANFQDELYYNQDNPNNPTGPTIEIHSESYQDAVRIFEREIRNYKKTLENYAR